MSNILRKKVYQSVIDRKQNWINFGLATSPDNYKVTIESEEEVFMRDPNDDKFDCLCGYIHINLPCYAEIDGKIVKFGYKREELEKMKIVKKEKYEKKEKIEKKEDKKDTFSLSIENITEEVKDYDIYDLCSPYGRVKKISVRRGIAFVSYFNEKDVNKAVEKLDIKGYNHLFLKVKKI